MNIIHSLNVLAVVGTLLQPLTATENETHPSSEIKTWIRFESLLLLSVKNKQSHRDENSNSHSGLGTMITVHIIIPEQQSTATYMPPAQVTTNCLRRGEHRQPYHNAGILYCQGES